MDLSNFEVTECSKTVGWWLFKKPCPRSADTSLSGRVITCSTCKDPICKDHQYSFSMSGHVWCRSCYDEQPMISF